MKASPLTAEPMNLKHEGVSKVMIFFNDSMIFFRDLGTFPLLHLLGWEPFRVGTSWVGSFQGFCY